MTQEYNSSLIQIESAKNLAIEKIEAASEKLDSKLLSQKNLINDAKIHLTEYVIEKSVGPLNRAILFLGVIFTILAAAGGVFTYTVTNNLESSLKSYLKHEVESWLSLGNEKSVASEILEDYRSRALLDAYMVKLARMSLSSNGLRIIEFKEADKKRLLDILTSSNSTNMDFHDALKLLSVSRGEWGYGRENDQIGNKLRGLFSLSTLSNERKLRVLEIMRNERGLLPIAEHFIQDKKSPLIFRHQAFLMLNGYRTTSKYGILTKEYASEILKGENEEYIMNDAAKYFAEKFPLSSEVANYLKKINNLNRENRLPRKIKLISSLSYSLPRKEHSFFPKQKLHTTKQTDLLREFITDLILDIIDSGARLNINKFDNKEFINISFGSVSGVSHGVFFDGIEKIFNDTKLIGEIFLASKRRNVSLAAIVKFFSISYRGESIVSLGYELSDKSKVLINKNNKILKDGVLWFKKKIEAGDIVLHWHDQYSVLHTFSINDVVLPKKYNIKINYNNDFIAYKSPYERLIF